MGNDLQKGTTYATGGVGGQGSITSSNLNAHVDDATIKSTFISAKTERTPGALTDNMVVESGGTLQRMLLSTLQPLLITHAAAPVGSIIQVVSATPYTANANLAIIPSDDTIPQNTEGTQILSLSITPHATANQIRLIFMGFGGNDIFSALTAALFRGSIANALVSTQATVSAAGARVVLAIDWVDSPGTTSAQTYTIRAGPSTGAGRMNGIYNARQLGGNAACTLLAQEIKA